MGEKRYQVFISSTFEDLREERRAVQDTIIQMGDFPVQMESFPAADEGQFEFIKPLIAQCDYYILVIGGRYGTVRENGLSYTHSEFRHAVKNHVPVLVIVHEDQGKIPADKSEGTEEGQKKLAEFISEATNPRLRTTWSNVDQLKLRVREALEHAKTTKPRTGWIRGNTATSLETLNELEKVRRQNEKYREVVDGLEVEISLPSIPVANEELELECFPVTSGGYGAINSGISVATTWIAIFPIFMSNLDWSCNDYNGDEFFWINKESSAQAIGSALTQQVCSHDVSNSYKLSQTSLDRLSAYYVEIGLMQEHGTEPFTNRGKMVARRFQITSSGPRDFSLSKGEIEVVPRNLDDEIPF